MSELCRDFLKSSAAAGQCDGVIRAGIFISMSIIIAKYFKE